MQPPIPIDTAITDTSAMATRHRVQPTFSVVTMPKIRWLVRWEAASSQGGLDFSAVANRAARGWQRLEPPPPRPD
jgi:hypothetical protein